MSNEVNMPHEPGVAADCIDDLDGIDLDLGHGCPHCGAEPDALYVPKAGYYGCVTCGALWAGDRNNADLHDPPHSGPAVQEVER